MHYSLSPLALSAGNYIKLAIESTLAFSPICRRLLAGLVAIRPAILGGVYHAVTSAVGAADGKIRRQLPRRGRYGRGLAMVAAGINSIRDRPA